MTVDNDDIVHIMRMPREELLDLAYRLGWSNGVDDYRDRIHPSTDPQHDEARQEMRSLYQELMYFVRSRAKDLDSNSGLRFEIERRFELGKKEGFKDGPEELDPPPRAARPNAANFNREYWMDPVTRRVVNSTPLHHMFGPTRSKAQWPEPTIGGRDTDHPPAVNDNESDGGPSGPGGPSGGHDPSGPEPTHVWEQNSDLLFDLRHSERALAPIRIRPESLPSYLRELPSARPQPTGEPGIPRDLQGQVEAFVNNQWVPLEGVAGRSPTPVGITEGVRPRLPITGALGIAQIYAQLLDMIMRDPVADIRYYQQLQEQGLHAIDGAKIYLHGPDGNLQNGPQKLFDDLRHWHFPNDGTHPNMNERYRRVDAAYTRLGEIAQNVFSSYGEEARGNMQMLQHFGLASLAGGPLIEAVQLIDREGLREDLLSPEFQQMIHLTRQMIGQPTRFSENLDGELMGLGVRMRGATRQAQALLESVRHGHRLTEAETQQLTELVQSATNISGQMHDWAQAGEPTRLCTTFAGLENEEASRLEAYSRTHYSSWWPNAWRQELQQAQEHRQRAASLMQGAGTLMRDADIMVQTIDRLKDATGARVATLDTPNANLSFGYADAGPNGVPPAQGPSPVPVAPSAAQLTGQQHA